MEKTYNTLINYHQPYTITYVFSHVTPVFIQKPIVVPPGQNSVTITINSPYIIDSVSATNCTVTTIGNTQVRLSNITGNITITLDCIFDTSEIWIEGNHSEQGAKRLDCYVTYTNKYGEQIERERVRSEDTGDKKIINAAKLTRITINVLDNSKIYTGGAGSWTLVNDDFTGYYTGTVSTKSESIWIRRTWYN